MPSETMCCRRQEKIASTQELCIWFIGKALLARLVQGGCRSGFCENTPEVAPMLDRGGFQLVLRWSLVVKAELISDLTPDKVDMP